MPKSPLRFLKDQVSENPKASIKINRSLAVFWAINFVVVVILYFFFPDVWEAMSILYLALVSIYANFVGHLSTVEAAQGNKKQDELEAKRRKEEDERAAKLVEQIDQITPDPDK